MRFGKYLFLIFVLPWAAGASPASEDGADPRIIIGVGTQTCASVEQLLNTPAMRVIIVSWYQGYAFGALTALQDDLYTRYPSLEDGLAFKFAGLMADAGKLSSVLRSYCTERPSKTFVQAAEELVSDAIANAIVYDPSIRSLLPDYLQTLLGE